MSWLWQPLPAAAPSDGPVNADLNVTEQNDTLAASATLEIQASLAAVEANDVASAAGALTITASSFITEADDAVTSNAALAIAANLAVTEGDDVPSAAGTVDIIGSLFAIEQDDTLLSNAALGIIANAVITEQDDTLTASGQVQLFIPRRGGTEEPSEPWRRELEWERALRPIIDQAFAIAQGLIDPVTLEPIPLPDLDGLSAALTAQQQALDQAGIEAFLAEDAGRQEEEAIAVLLLAA